MTQAPPDIADRDALRLHRARAFAADAFLHQIARDELRLRLSEVNRTFTNPAIITGLPQIWADFLPEARLLEDTARLDLNAGAHDLVIHAMGLHWASDPVGQLVQARHALRPDGLLLAVCFGGQTLAQLRACMAQAESDVMGGLSPRVLPMGEVRSMGALLQRAGFALPVADVLTQNVAYRSFETLVRDLRAMGETNALAARQRKPAPRALFDRAKALYRAHHSDDQGRLCATYELIFLTGWAPDASQPQPLRPGSAKVSLTEVLPNRDKA